MRNPNISPVCGERDPAISISMDDDQVVIRPQRRLDHEATVALNAVLNAAVIAGSTVVVELELDDRTGAHPTSPAPHAVACKFTRDQASGTVTEVVTAGPGCITIASTGSWWTIDLVNRRFCRSATPVDPRFVGLDLWIGVRKVWVSAARMTVLTAGDTLISAPRHRLTSATGTETFDVMAS